VTGFAKRGLPHTSNLPTLTIDLKLGQQEAPAYLNNWEKFHHCMPFDNHVMVFQVQRIGYVWKTVFANLVTFTTSPISDWRHACIEITTLTLILKLPG